MEESLWLNARFKNVAEGWLSTYNAVGKQPSISLVNLKRKWALNRWWWWILSIFEYRIAYIWIFRISISYHTTLAIDIKIPAPLLSCEILVVLFCTVINVKQTHKRGLNQKQFWSSSSLSVPQTSQDQQILQFSRQRTSRTGTASSRTPVRSVARHDKISKSSEYAWTVCTCDISFESLKSRAPLKTCLWFRESRLRNKLCLRLPPDCHQITTTPNPPFQKRRTIAKTNPLLKRKVNIWLNGRVNVWRSEGLTHVDRCIV